MDYVLDWPLILRDEDDMNRLFAGLPLRRAVQPDPLRGAADQPVRGGDPPLRSDDPAERRASAGRELRASEPESIPAVSPRRLGNPSWSSHADPPRRPFRIAIVEAVPAIRQWLAATLTLASPSTGQLVFGARMWA